MANCIIIHGCHGCPSNREKAMDPERRTCAKTLITNPLFGILEVTNFSNFAF